MPPSQHTRASRRGPRRVALLSAIAAMACLTMVAGPLGAAGSSASVTSRNPAPRVPGADAAVLDLAFNAASCAVRAGAVADPGTLTVIDYSRPSTEKRLFVFDLRSNALLYSELVAHGQGSGENIATRFSNEPNTHASSLGLFVAQNTYIGKNGYSLRLAGLDQGFNDRAHERAIVMHGAPYVNPDAIPTMGRLGRSWGCPALRPAIAKDVIDRVKNGGLVFAYYPDPQWLKTSKYLGACAAAQS